MKKIVLAVTFLFALSSVAMASPLTDYSKGKAALDINYRVSTDYDASAGIKGTELQTGKIAFDGDSNLEWGFTYGIGNNWALQYRQATPQGKLNLFNYSQQQPEVGIAQADYIFPITAANVDLTAKTRVEEYNVLYKMDKNFSLFTGIVKANPSLKVNASAQLFWEANYGADISVQGHDKNIWHLGFIANAPLTDKFNAYGLASFGRDYRNWEAGLGYAISKDIELNVNYRDMKVDDMKVIGISTPDASYDVTTDTKLKGWGFGITYKF